MLLSFGLVACGGDSSNETKQQDNDNVEKVDESEKEPGVTDKDETESEDSNVSREYRNALKSAQNYIDMMHFSEKGLYEQLTSEYGEQYPADAAQYAIENVKVDWNEEALEAAQSYLEIMPMSDAELFEQLTSEYGEQFTEEQAQYAIDNLPD